MTKVMTDPNELTGFVVGNLSRTDLQSLLATVDGQLIALASSAPATTTPQTASGYAVSDVQTYLKTFAGVNGYGLLKSLQYQLQKQLNNLPTGSTIADESMASGDANTAHAGGTQAAGLALTSQVNRISVVASVGDSVVLPPSVPGLMIIVINSAAKAVGVFGTGADTVNGVAAATGVLQMGASVGLYFCSAIGAWYANLGVGYSGSFSTVWQNAGISAAGTTQPGATALTAEYNQVTTVAAGAGVALPPALVGMQVTVSNQGANQLQVYGNNTAADTINSIATGTGLSQGVGTIVVYTCAVAGNWESSAAGSYKAACIAVGGATPALAPHSSGTYVFNRAGVVGATLAAPTAGTDDGTVIDITSDTAQAHTLTATGLLDTGAAGTGVLTFAANKGSSLRLMAFNGRWKLMYSNGITVTS